MSATEAAARPPAGTSSFGARHALVLISLLWAVQLPPIVGLLGGNAQAEIAQHFHTTQIAWFTLIGALVGTFVIPFAVKAAGIFGKRRVMIVITVFGLVGDLIAALATGGILTTLGYGLLAQFHHSVGQIVANGFIAGVGMGIVVSVIPLMVIAAVSPAEQAQANGAQSLAQGVVQVVVSQLAFVLMAQNGTVAHGTQFYLDSGFTKGFWLVTGFCAVGVLLVALIPRTRRLDDADAGAEAVSDA